MDPRSRPAREAAVRPVPVGRCMTGPGIHLGTLKRTEAVIRAADNSGVLNSIPIEFKSRMVPLHYPTRVHGAGILCRGTA